MNNFDKNDLDQRKNLNQDIESGRQSLQLMPENSSNTAGPDGEPHEDYKDLSVHYYEPEE